LQNDIVQQNQLRTILSQYPEVMFFSGHTQLQLGLEHDIVKDQFTMVNDSSVGMLVDGNNKSVPNDSEGLLVTVYKNKVLIRGKNFANHTWISKATYNIKY
jgi:hypothetical protein